LKEALRDAKKQLEKVTSDKESKGQLRSLVDSLEEQLETAMSNKEISFSSPKVRCSRWSIRNKTD